jgi:glyceraldehyde 3-phosphate dehydrogenase
MVRVAINGFGRIGRMVLKAGIKDPDIEWVAVNDLTDTKTLAHLLKYDSVHKKFPGQVEATDGSLKVDGKEIKVLAEKDPTKLPWKDLNIDVVVESTGFFTTKEKASMHLTAGAKKVLLSAPAKDEVDFTVILGVNDDKLDKEKHKIISNGSCTTNSLAPIVKILKDNFGFKKGFFTTIHSYTGDQRLVDAPHKDLRRSRAAALNIVPTTTGAAKTVAKAIPEVEGKLDGIAVRVPTPTGSFTDLVCELERGVEAKDVNDIFKQMAEGKFKGIIEYTDEPIVSTDIIGNPASAIIDGSLTKVIDGTTLKLCGWYDNEWGYSARMVEMLKKL